jgi:hypothetical protein
MKTREQKIGLAFYYSLLAIYGVILVYMLITIILDGYSVPWTGFGEYTKPDANFVPGKTLWDWMELLIIPLFLGIGLFLLNRSDKKTELTIATDRKQEEILQAYLDRISDLLLDKKLLTTEDEEVRDVARIRTLTVLRALDGTRKGFVLRFLYEAGLIRVDRQIVNLAGADLSGAKLENVIMTNADLEDANMEGVHLERAELSGSNLKNTNMKFAHLHHANLTGAQLNFAKFDYADLTNTTLVQAEMTFARLYEANLHHASVDHNFKFTNLYRTIMPDGKKADKHPKSD